MIDFDLTSNMVCKLRPNGVQLPFLTMTPVLSLPLKDDGHFMTVDPSSHGDTNQLILVLRSK